ncbi:LacI family DNA-binding transcriptional regulator [Poriferisphaera sp. WC338]|uniref:LacI family DNA-binding transcriptional regulator n=1 Tax=Poriferisphaera sp. WC338 TaxID=3425129 RepID=UPI003D8156B2
MSNTKVAQALGVSEATVSRVMNNQPGVSKSTAQRVREMAAKLGVGSRAHHSSLEGIRYNTVGLVVLSADAFQRFSQAYHQTIAGVEDALRSKGVEMIYARASEPSQLPPRISAGEVDGLILAGTHPDPATLRVIEKLPQVWVCSHREDDCDMALEGNHAVAQLAADYLLGRGHISLAAISPLASHPAMRARLEYFEYLVTRQNASVKIISCDVDETLLEQTDVEDDPLRRLAEVVDGQVEEMLACEPRPTGIMAANDMVSGMIYAALQKRGIRPGIDIEIIGSEHDGPALSGLYPRPATIDIAAFTMGRRSVEQLLWRIAHPNEPHAYQVVVKPWLVHGDDINESLS